MIVPGRILGGAQGRSGFGDELVVPFSVLFLGMTISLRLVFGFFSIPPFPHLLCRSFWFISSDS